MDNWYHIHAAQSLDRLLPHIKTLLPHDSDGAIFESRVRRYFPTIFQLLHQLYGDRYDFFYHLEAILTVAATSFADRPTDLKILDLKREAQPNWFQGQDNMGAVCYVDRFAGNLSALEAKLNYFTEMGITYLHLMPLFECPDERNDGGYAVSSFRRVNPTLGTMAQLSHLCQTFRKHGISLVVDFVFNHTSEEHDWARKAISGDSKYQAYYHMFDNRDLPDAYERNLREIFPEQAPGSFTWRPDINKWVWTTFFNYQWDLNYANPEVFAAMLDEMLFLANQGIEILRLDAVPFIWKQLGTNCENLPQAHLLIRAFNALVRVSAPTLLFKSEAIVHPRDVQSYISSGECQLSYNPIMMVCLWDAIATRDTRLLTHTMQQRFALPDGTAWVNYVRSHDDIGWGFADEDAAAVGINGNDHRYFLNQFYTGKFPGSYARGVPFNYNPKTQDMRISGTTASLMGLEEAIAKNEYLLIAHALNRILLCQSIVLAAGGIPLIYLGDELGTLNDYGYQDEPHLAEDSRWIHRPRHDWNRANARHQTNTTAGQLYTRLLAMIHWRKQLPELANGATTFYALGNPHILAFSRQEQFLLLGNFSDQAQVVTPSHFAHFLIGAKQRDLLSDDTFDSNVTLDPWQVRWIKRFV